MVPASTWKWNWENGFSADKQMSSSELYEIFWYVWIQKWVLENDQVKVANSQPNPDRGFS